MLQHFNIWQLLAGVALFLIGITFMEEALKQLSGRRFKLFLKKQTGHKGRAIVGGALVTALMQSSSVVNLLVLSLVGAGVIQMQQALALMLGANLGSTFTGWLVATFGFSFDIASFALPLLAVAGIIAGFAKPASKVKHWTRFLSGFALLFIGLAYMKEGMEAFVKATDLRMFAGYPLVFFLFLGWLLTTLVQASSVTMALTLSALYVNAITLPMAAGIILGAEIGTTMKLALASVNGIAAKKRVALGNILFNIISTLVMIVLLQHALYFITEILGLKHQLYALVFFQSFINLTGIILFFPFLKLFGQFLESRFVHENESLFLHKVNPLESDLALQALDKECRHFLEHVIAFSISALGVQHSALHGIRSSTAAKKSLPEQYEDVKRLYGEIHQFYIRMQQTPQAMKDTERLEQLIIALRNGMYAAKSIKDALPDIQQLANSSNDVKFQFFERVQQQAADFYQHALQLLEPSAGLSYFERLTALFQGVQQHYADELKNLYRSGIEQHLTETEISTLFNFNREMVTAYKSLVFALKDYLLTPEQGSYFDELPGFIH